MKRRKHIEIRESNFVQRQSRAGHHCEQLVLQIASLTMAYSFNATEFEMMFPALILPSMVVDRKRQQELEKLEIEQQGRVVYIAKVFRKNFMVS